MAADESIEHALRERRLDIWYQPKIDLRRECLAGAQALPRIRDPMRGALPPQRFAPSAGPSGLLRLAEHTLISTLRDWSMFDQAGFNLKLSVNVPASVLLKLPVATLVRESRPRAAHWPGFVIGVGADEIARDLPLAGEIAKQLEIDGVSVAIDDFGAGNCSFASLRGLPFAELKLHASLVKDCADEGINGAICQTVIDLAHRIGSRAVADGIENVPDLHALLVMCCDFGQGALLCPPLPKERFIALLYSRLSRAKAQPVAAAMPGMQVA